MENQKKSMARFIDHTGQKAPRRIKLSVLLTGRHTIGRINGLQDIGKATLYLVESYPKKFTKKELQDLFNEYHKTCIPNAKNKLSQISEEEKQRIEHFTTCQLDDFITDYLKPLDVVEDESHYYNSKKLFRSRSAGTNRFDREKLLDKFFTISDEEDNEENREYYRNQFNYTCLAYGYEVVECLRKMYLYSTVFEGIDPNKTAYQVTLIDIQVHLYKIWKAYLNKRHKHRYIFKYRYSKIALKGLDNIKFKERLISNMELLELHPNKNLEMEIADFVPTFENWKNHIKWVDESIGTEALD